MKRIKLFFSALLILLATNFAFAQSSKVSGVVKDARTGDVLPFASIMVKDSMNGVIADAEGNFIIEVADKNKDILIFSCVGYTDLAVAVGGKETMIVNLETNNILDDVVVVAYGTMKKEALTGSVTSIKSESIKKHVTTNVTSALAGTTPGVQMISSSGDPAGNSSAIRIRGFGSMSASNTPLYIVDGMPYDGAISDINPNDVESISILKDASASAIYGARGANGVVMITTKRASSGEATVRFDSKWGSNSRLIPQYDVITDPAAYYETHYKMMYNSQIYAGKSKAEAYAFADKYLFDENNGGLGYQVYTIPEGEKFIGTNFKLNPNATLGYSDGTYTYLPDNWYDETFHDSFRHEYNISVSGSDNRFSYYASVGYLNDGGIVDNSNYERYSARINADYEAKKWLRVTTNLSFSHSDSQVAQYSNNFGSSGNLFYITNNMGPIYPLYVRDAEGNIMYENGFPVYDANQTGFKRPSVVGNAVRNNMRDRTKSYADVLNGKWGLVLTPVRGLTLSANLGVMADNTRSNSLYSRFGSGSATDGIASVGQSRTFAVNSQYIAEYRTDFNGSFHNLDALAGFEMYDLVSQGLSGSNDHLFDPFVGELNNADGKSNRTTNSNTNKYVTQGFLARVQYNYAGKYFASASFRRDASSRFHPDNRWGNFGSVGGAWIISKESFMEDASWVDVLKLKASYGVQGNDNLGSYYPYADAYSHSYNEDTKEYSNQLIYKGNKELTWESSHAFNLGLEFDLFHGRLNGSVEFFDRITSDLLYNKDVPLSAGNPTGFYPVNVGSISNMGVEVTLGGNIINQKNVHWDWNLNLSSYRNKILSLDDSVSEEGIKGSNRIIKVGGSLYDAYMKRFAGVDKETGEAMWYKKEMDEEGNPTGKDITTKVFTEADQYELGTILPKVYGGFGTTFSAYGFDLSAQFSFQLGGKYYDGTYQALMHTGDSDGNAWHKDIMKAWTPENTDTNIPRLDGNKLVGQSAVDNYMISSNYLSINNVTLGYTLPSKLTSKIKISGLRVYFSAENLAVTSARQGVDPRYSVGLGSYTSGSGLNSGAYSAMRTLTGGLTFTF